MVWQGLINDEHIDYIVAPNARYALGYLAGLAVSLGCEKTDILELRPLWTADTYHPIIRRTTKEDPNEQ